MATIKTARKLFRFILSVGILVIVAMMWLYSGCSLRLMARKYTSSQQPNSTGHSAVYSPLNDRLVKLDNPSTSEPSSDSGIPPEFLDDEFLGNNVDGSFPTEGPCHYFGLRKVAAGENKKTNQPKIVCKPHRPTNEACSKANSYFGKPGTVVNNACTDTNHPDICKFQDPPAGSRQQKLECNLGVCGGNVSVGTIDKDLGKIIKWKLVSLTDAVLEIVRSTFADGFPFCFLECCGIKQVLWFPPKLKATSKWKADEKINVNILLLDSVSRPHFYRVLPKAVKALRDIIYDKNISATALDFELLQGIGQHTFENIRPIFSGLVGGNPSNSLVRRFGLLSIAPSYLRQEKLIIPYLGEINHSLYGGRHEDFSSAVKKAEVPLGLAVLYGKYQSLGYQTVFQEDLCWIDRWGVHLTGLERRSPPSSDSEYKSRWADYKNKISTYHLDEVGLTHFSCEVFKRYNQTNPFDMPDKICLNGQFFEKYFLDYITAMLTSVGRGNSAPVIAYQHLNTAHTPYGKRIINLDGILANYFNKMARDRNTLTIVLADHGHTRTSYAETLEGRFELFNPIMFVIVPHHVARLLGKERMAALVENQKRLFTTADIHKALMTLHDKTPSSDYRTSGIFATISGNRTCADLPLLPLTRCKCDGWDQTVADNAPKHKWLAERALGNINNNIQEQFTKGKKVKGYGHCMRLQGLTYHNIIEHQDGQSLITNFDLHVTPPRDLKEDETFKVALKHSIKPADGVEVLKVVRHSMYKYFITCQDEAVDIKLCVCEQGFNKSVIETKEDIMKVISRPQFGAETKLTDLHSGCLYLMTRKHDKMTIAYELANVCQDKTFSFTMRVKTAYNMMLTRVLPFEFKVQPRTIHWLVAAVRFVLNDSNLDIDTSVRLL